MKCLNQVKRKESGWKSAFEIYFGRKVNELKNEGKNHDKTIHLAQTVGPSTKDFRNQKHNTNQWRKKAREADLRIAERMMENDIRRNAYKIYKSGDKVFVRLGSKRYRSTTRHSVLTGTILKRYKVQLQMPGSKQISEQKFRIEDIVDQPVKEKSNRRRFQEKLLISLTKCDRIEQFTDQGYNVVYDPPGDGNCQFSALCFALRNIGLHRSPEYLRIEVVQYLTVMIWRMVVLWHFLPEFYWNNTFKRCK